MILILNPWKINYSTLSKDENLAPPIMGIRTLLIIIFPEKKINQKKKKKFVKVELNMLPSLFTLSLSHAFYSNLFYFKKKMFRFRNI